MTKQEVIERVNKHNRMIDEFMKDTLPQLLEMAGINVKRKTDGNFEIPMNDWFRAQDFIAGMNFYSQAKKILDEVRPFGFDVKINMQNNKLVF